MLSKFNKVADANDFARRLKDRHFNLKIMNIRQLIALGFDQEAYKELQQVQEMKEKTMKQHLKLADCYYKIGKFQESLDILSPLEENISAMKPSATKDKLYLLNLLGLIYKGLQKEELAVKKWKNCLELNSRYTIALNNLGNHLMHRQLYEDAAKCYWRSKKCRHQFTRLREAKQPSSGKLQLSLLFLTGQQGRRHDRHDETAKRAGDLPDSRHERLQQLNRHRFQFSAFRHLSGLPSGHNNNRRVHSKLYQRSGSPQGKQLQ